MKLLQLLFISTLIFACSNTKPVAKNIPQKDAEVKKEVTDSITKTSVVKNSNPIETKQKTNDSLIIDHDTQPLKDSIKKPHHNDFNKLLNLYVSENGTVNYVDFKKRQLELQNYISYLGKTTPEDSWSKKDKLAYWINAYNAMTIDLILRNYPIQSIKNINKPWKQRLWKLGNKWYNLEDIEHQILRKMDEPRIHFAIVCASYSCPKLLNEAYTASKLEPQLTNATKYFLANKNSITANHLKLSKIFQWFSKDFNRNGTLIDFLNKYSAIKISNQAKISFKTYNWNLNE